MTDKPHKTLDAWKNSIDLTVIIYQLTDRLPESERFGLIVQMRRAAVSIASNIAEGAARQTKKEFIHFLHVAQASLSELDTQGVICKELGYFSDADVALIDEKIEKESKLISGLIKFLQKRD